MSALEGASPYIRAESNLAALGLDQMAASLPDYMRMVSEGDLEFCAALAEMTAAEVAAKEARVTRQRIRSAGFPYEKTLADFDWSFQPSVPRARVEELATLRFMERAENVLLVGSPGVGVSATAKSAERATLSRRRRPRFPAGGATALWPPALPRAAAQGALDRGVVEVRGPDLNLQRRGALGVPGRDRPARDLPSAELREPDRHRDVLCAERGQPPRGVRGPHDCPLSGSPSPSAASASRSFMR